jgi:hypothetical protein
LAMNSPSAHFTDWLCADNALARELW